MNNLVKVAVCASAVVSTALSWAEFDDLDGIEDDSSEIVDDEPQDVEDSEDSSDEDESESSAKPAKVSPDKPFNLMPLCKMLEGEGEVRRPGSTKWLTIEEGRFYPLGCTFRTLGSASRMTMQFGEGSEVLMSGDSSFSTVAKPIGTKSRTITLEGGFLTVKLPRALGDGLFSVTTPGFTVENLAGDSTYRFKRTGDGDEAVVRCVTGNMSISGRHFSIAKMSVANELRIRTSHDYLFTGLYGNSGDFIVKLDQGVVAVPDFETKETHDEPRFLEWHLSPKKTVRIHRAVPAIGDRMAVTVMTFDTNGELQNRCAFTEGRSEINTGELGTAALEKLDDESAKKAAEAADTISIEEDEDEDEDSSDDSSADDESGDDEEEDSSGDDDEDLF